MGLTLEPRIVEWLIEQTGRAHPHDEPPAVCGACAVYNYLSEKWRIAHLSRPPDERVPHEEPPMTADRPTTEPRTAAAMDWRHARRCEAERSGQEWHCNCGLYQYRRAEAAQGAAPRLGSAPSRSEPE